MAVDFNEIGKALLEEIAELDEKLDSYQDPSTLGKRKVTNDLIAAQESSWTNVVSKLVENLNALDSDEKRYGSYFGLMKGLREAFGDSSTKFVDAVVEAQPKTETVDVSEDEKKAVAALRSKRYGEFKQLRTLLVDAMGKIDADDPEWAMPKVRRANVGRRGKRALTQMNWTIDGEELNPEETTYKDVANAVGFDLAKDLTIALKAAGVNTSKPGEGFDVTVNGKNVVATLQDGAEPQFPDAEDSDNGSDDEDESEDDD